MKLYTNFNKWQERHNKQVQQMSVFIFFGALIVLLLVGIGLSVYQRFYPSNTYQYNASYIDKNQTIYERQYNPKQHKYRIKMYESLKQPNGSSKWKYTKSIDYSKYKPSVAYLRKVSKTEFQNMLTTEK